MMHAFSWQILLAFALLHSVLQGLICLLLQVFLHFLLLHSSPFNEKDIVFWYQFQKVLQVFIELYNFSFFCITGRGIGLDYRDIEWFALEMNRTEIILSFLRLHPSTVFPTLLLAMMKCLKLDFQFPQRLGDRFSVLITLQRDGFKVLEKDIPGL